MYFEIGKYLYQKVSSEKWGAKVIETISKEINKANPTLKGFDKRGLFRTMQFYETYKDYEIVSPLVSQISWTNNLIIFSHESSVEEKNLYQALYKEQLFQKRIRKTNIKPLLRKIAVSEYSTKLIDKKMLESKLIEFKDLLTK